MHFFLAAVVARRFATKDTGYRLPLANNQSKEEDEREEGLIDNSLHRFA